MNKKLLIEEKERMLKMMNFKYEDNSHDILSEQNIKISLLPEQDDKEGMDPIDISLPNNINVQGGKIGLTKRELRKKRKAEKKEEEAKIEEANAQAIKKLFVEKFATEVTNAGGKFFKKLPSTLKEDMLSAWFNEGGLPKDFWYNIDKYSFRVKNPPQGIPAIMKGTGGLRGEEAKKLGEQINKTYQNLDTQNFTNYNGKSNNYKFFKQKGRQPDLSKGALQIDEATVNGYQLLVIAPTISTGEGLEGAETTERQNQPVTLNLNVPDLPVAFPVRGSNISQTDATALLTTLQNAINNNPQIQNARQTPGAVITINNVGVTSSASNSWGAPTPFTHNRDRTPADTSNGNNPNPSTYTGNDLLNFNLARARGNTLLNLLRSDQRFIQALGITNQTNFDNIDARVTDTGGVVDPPNAPANTRGQYASFDFEISITFPTPPTLITKTGLRNFVVYIQGSPGAKGYAKAFGIHFTKSKYLKRGGKQKSSGAISRNLGKSFRGFGPLLDKLLP